MAERDSGETTIVACVRHRKRVVAGDDRVLHEWNRSLCDSERFTVSVTRPAFRQEALAILCPVRPWPESGGECTCEQAASRLPQATPQDIARVLPDSGELEGYRPYHLPGCPARTSRTGRDCSCGGLSSPVWEPGDEPRGAGVTG